MERYHHHLTLPSHRQTADRTQRRPLHWLIAFLMISFGWLTEGVSLPALADDPPLAVAEQPKGVKDMPKGSAEQTTLYLHLQFDGGIFIIPHRGEPAYVSEAQLRNELLRVKQQSGTLLYSREQPDNEPPAFIEEIFRTVLSYEIPIQFIEAHPYVASRPDDYVPPLIVAAYQGDIAWLSTLIAYGVDLDAPDQYQQTALMMAANAGQLEAVQRLLAAGATVNAWDYQGSTPLMFAAQHGYVSIVNLLMAAGADVKARGTHGFSALDFARQNHHPEVVALLQ